MRFVSPCLCLQSHRQVSLCKHKKFVAWLEKWHQEKVTSEEDQACEDWLMGRQECILPSTSTTRVEVRVPLHRLLCPACAHTHTHT